MSEMSKVTQPYHTVLFDMDGTLLDLAFDNYIWMQLVPEIWAQQQQLDLITAKQRLYQFYLTHQGSLNWYSSQFWQQQLGIDVLALQQHHQDKIAPRPFCFELLQQLRSQNIACWLVTNADTHTLALKLKNVDLSPYFDIIISSETLGHPKEAQKFWQNLQQRHPFDAKSSILVDDNYDVLASAKQYGIGKMISILQPDSSHSRTELNADYQHLNQLTELLNFISPAPISIKTTALD